MELETGKKLRTGADLLNYYLVSKDVSCIIEYRWNTQESGECNNEL